MKSTYMDGIMSCVQHNTLSTHWDQISAATGRLSSYQPNVQAIPKAPILLNNYQESFIVGKTILKRATPSKWFKGFQ